MFVAIIHEIHDRDLFNEKVDSMPPPPDGLLRHWALNSADLTRAVCLWEGPSVESVRDYIDACLEPASTQTYWPVHEEFHVGLPAQQLA